MVNTNWVLRILKYNAIPNVTSTNKKFYFNTDDKIITISEGSYELCAINKYLSCYSSHTTTLNNKDNNDDDDNDDDGSNHKEETLILQANENTIRSEIKCAYRINFTKPNNIGLLLSYSKSRIIQTNRTRLTNL